MLTAEEGDTRSKETRRHACIEVCPALTGENAVFHLLPRNAAADKTADNISENRDRLSEPSSASPSYRFVGNTLSPRAKLAFHDTASWLELRHRRPNRND